MIGPAVIAALEFVGAAFVERDHERATVSALVVQNVDLAVRTAHHHDRLAAKIGAEIVAGLSNLALVSDINPG
jgi:hypothetical protein